MSTLPRPVDARARPRLGACGVRSATAHDAEALAALCRQVHHLVSPSQIADRLVVIMRNRGGVVLAAVSEDQRVLGWLHADPRYSLGAPAQAEICGLVVDSAYRGARIGSMLLASAEIWARHHGLREMLVRSSLMRENADAFYRARGYEHVSELQQYRKAVVC